MFRNFDSALTQALSSEFSMFGESYRSLAAGAARRGSSENSMAETYRKSDEAKPADARAVPIVKTQVAA